ncbi:hypothetical protein ACFS3C_15330 [Azotobacter vinelandii]
MHHDHEAEAQRVSRSIALDVALEELCERNRDLYDARSRRLLLSHARELRGEFSLGDLWLNTLHRRNSGPLRIYLRQHLRKLDPALRPGPK